ncbi:hypothetical protein B0H19DRAFT_1083915 [Mycena capillaripes]|nr:hypothetical protein B0H19DRAFT_1083915 [Mycena capillaripes]
MGRDCEEPLRDDEASINGVLEEYDADEDAVFNDKLVETILPSGYSCFPSHESHDPVELRLIKKCAPAAMRALTYVSSSSSSNDPALTLSLTSFPLWILPEAPPSTDCFLALDYL